MWISVVAACGLGGCGSQAREHRLSSCGTEAWLLGSMWDLPGRGVRPVSPVVAGRFFTTEPSEKPVEIFLRMMISQLQALVYLRDSILQSSYPATMPCHASNIHHAPRLCRLAISLWNFPGHAIMLVLFLPTAFSASSAAFFLAVAGASVPVGSSRPDLRSCLWGWFQDTSNPSQQFYLSKSLQTEAPRAVILRACFNYCKIADPTET